MTLTLHLPSEEQARLSKKAEAAGMDVEAYIERIVRVAVTRPSIDAVLRPIREAFHASGMTDEQLGDLLENTKHEMRAGRRARQAP